jgi:1-acyl-sn-glycerol-3-phosphate acyltransferase
VVKLSRALRSGAFVALFCCYAILIIDLGQRLVLWPLIRFAPRRRAALVRAWLRGHARATLAMARTVAGVRLSIRGEIPRESCIVVMNHQSVLDIPLGLALIPGPQTVIPTRERYRNRIPAISGLGRLAGFPFVAQGRALTRDELRALTTTADLVARGERSLLIFAEGTRTRDGRIGPFMRSGLRLVLKRAHRPVYCIVADGLLTARTTMDALSGFAGAHVHAVILGPFAAPEDRAAASVDAFIDTLHERMARALDELRARAAAPSAADDVAPAIAAR